jgi:hypothetical protein
MSRAAKSAFAETGTAVIHYFAAPSLAARQKFAEIEVMHRFATMAALCAAGLIASASPAETPRGWTIGPVHFTDSPSTGVSAVFVLFDDRRRSCATFGYGDNTAAEEAATKIKAALTTVKAVSCSPAPPSSPPPK